MAWGLLAPAGASAADDAPSAPAGAPAAKIVGWGDSIARIWLPALGELGFDVVNLAEGASTTGQWRPGASSGYFERLREHLPADLCLVQLGTNDPTVLGGVPAKFHKVWLSQIVAAALAAGCRRVRIVQPPDAALDPKREALLPAYRAAQLELCAETDGVVCGPDLSAVLHWPDDMPDGLHPDAEGSVRAARAVAAAIRAETEPP